MSHKKKHTTKERFAILENVSAQLYVAIDVLRRRLDKLELTEEITTEEQANETE
tara:strand:+ start:424 stop:585 length:162 start_codon:yes stop_codon:yes gene_type:complete